MCPSTCPIPTVVESSGGVGGDGSLVGGWFTASCPSVSHWHPAENERKSSV